MKHIIHKHRKRTFFSAILIAVLLFFVLRAIGWVDLYHALISMRPIYIVIAFIMSILITLVKTGVWHTFLSKLGYPLKFIKTFILVYASQFLHAVIPVGAIGSKPVSAYILYKHTKIPTEKSLAAITISDFLRMSLLFTLAWIGLIVFMVKGNLSIVTWIIFAGGIIMGAVMIISFLILWKKEQWLDVIGLFLGSLVIKVEHFFKKGSKTWEKHFKKEIKMEIHIYEKTMHEIVNKLSSVFSSYGLALIEWLFTLGLLYLILYSMGILVPWYILFMVFPASSLAALLPIPGGFGGIEITMGGLLVLLGGIGAAEAAIATLLFRAFYCWVPMLFGLWSVSYLSGTRITPKDLVPHDIITRTLKK